LPGARTRPRQHAAQHHHASKTAGNDDAAPGDRPDQVQHALDDSKTGAESAYSSITVRDRDVTGTRSLLGPGSGGRALDIVTTFDSGTANRFGLKVFVGNGEGSRP
jgi:hypothetical protein